MYLDEWVKKWRHRVFAPDVAHRHPCATSRTLKRAIWVGLIGLMESSRNRVRRTTTRVAWSAAVWVALLLFSTVGAGQGFFIPSADTPDEGQVLNTAIHPFHRNETTVVEDKVPLLEMFTASWCPPCAPADRAIERLMAEKSPGLRAGAFANQSHDEIQLALLSYHPFPDVGGEDPFGIPEGHNRLSEKHDVFWFPSAYVDGVLEDAPQTRETAVDVGLEETLYNSYRNLISSAEGNDPPFTLSVQTEQISTEPPEWEVHVRVEATRGITTPLFMQGTLWEDHVHFPGSSGVENHRMVVRAMAPQALAPDGLAAGEIWEETLRLTAPPAVDPAKAGAAVIIEAQWGRERDERAGLFFGFALFVAIGSVATAAWQINTKSRRRQHGKTATSATEEKTDEPMQEHKEGGT